MEKNENLMLWKGLAVGAALFYLYKLSKANGGSLQGNPMGVNINSDKIIDLASHLVVPEKRPMIKHYARKIVSKMTEV